MNISNPAPEHDVESEPKRRKIRKGTRSCWECKRRKMKCSFSVPSDSVCIACRKRGSVCVSQEQPEDQPEASSGDRGGYISDRLVRVEALLERLVKHIEDGPNSSSSTSSSTPRDGDESGVDAIDSVNTTYAVATRETAFRPEHISLSSGDGLESGLSAVNRQSQGARYKAISTALYAALPPRKDIDLMIRAGIDISIHQIMTHPFAVLKQNGGAGKANLAGIPSADTHPALLAKYLLTVATCLQFSHPELHAEVIGQLSEPPRVLMHRMAEAALSLVTSNDELLGSIEGLECVLLEVMYHANGGNLRRAWFSCRRAMVVAQMMGIHRGRTQHPLNVIDPREPIYPDFIWYRIICTDRQLSLMLGLPQGSLDTSIASEAALASETPEGRFERKQTAIASRVLERNESLDPVIMEDLITLEKLDAELRAIANEMPSKWWLIPNLASGGNDSEMAFWEMLRLLDQVFYFNLLQLLHLPYVLRSSTSNLNRGDDTTGNKYEYSKLASINASRELLSRFIMFRSYNRVAYCCRSVDFFALTASMTLVIAHLDGHRRQRQKQHEGNFATLSMLSNQRTSDRAMMEQVLENMQAVAQLNTDVLSERSSNLLQSLLVLEAEAAVNKQGPGEETHQFLRIEIPYFGTIRIGREGIVSMEQRPRPTPQSLIQNQQSGMFRNQNDATPQISKAAGNDFVSAEQSLSNTINPEILAIDQHSTQLQPQQAIPLPLPRFPSAINDVLQEEYLYPGLTAGVDDWTFQGVDFAFFDSLMKGSGIDNSQDQADSTSWEDDLGNM